MRRIAATVILAAGVGAFALLAGGATGPTSNSGASYWVELDNAFGLVPGADVKIAGVRAGKIDELKLNRQTYKALVKISLTGGHYTSLRSDVFCETRPQSLIGEYFINCEPGHSSTVLKGGSTIPVARTQTTVAPDLVNNILRLPERQRLRIILNELGVTVAARGSDLNDVIRRAVPALRETDKVLAILARQNRVLENLTRDGDQVITALSNNRHNVGRFVVEARNTAVASAARNVDLQATFHKLPDFLEQLQPAMQELGRTADAQTPALQDLNASAGQLTRFFRDLGPFSDASRPAIRSLGELSVVGHRLVAPARATVSQLRKFTAHAPELGKNLAIVLEDLYDRKRAVEKDPRSPGGQGYNGLEALLGYVFWQSQAINIFDKNGYILKVNLVAPADCTNYHDAAWAKNPANAAARARCNSQLGPTQPGINAPDGSVRTVAQQRAASSQALAQQRNQAVLSAGQNAAGVAPAPGAAPAAPGTPQSNAPAIDISKTLGSLLGGQGPILPLGQNGLPSPSSGQGSSQSSSQLLDYLLGQ